MSASRPSTRCPKPRKGPQRPEGRLSSRQRLGHCRRLWSSGAHTSCGVPPLTHRPKPVFFASREWARLEPRPLRQRPSCFLQRAPRPGHARPSPPSLFPPRPGPAPEPVPAPRMAGGRGRRAQRPGRSQRRPTFAHRRSPRQPHASHTAPRRDEGGLKDNPFSAHSEDTAPATTRAQPRAAPALRHPRPPSLSAHPWERSGVRRRPIVGEAGVCRTAREPEAQAQLRLRIIPSPGPDLPGPGPPHGGTCGAAVDKARPSTVRIKVGQDEAWTLLNI